MSRTYSSYVKAKLHLPRMHGDEPNGGMTHDPGIESAPARGDESTSFRAYRYRQKSAPYTRGCTPTYHVGSLILVSPVCTGMPG